MSLSPDAQKAAQTELDAVVGSQRLPEFADESSLPYVCALIRECLRWRPVLPLGLPHRAIEEDVYRGYRIPKGAMLLPNTWSAQRAHSGFTHLLTEGPGGSLTTPLSIQTQ